MTAAVEPKIKNQANKLHDNEKQFFCLKASKQNPPTLLEGDLLIYKLHN